jgi:ADP-ribose pyrophosphatase YjhB (NUDIX family)
MTKRERYKISVAVFVFLEKNDQLLLIKRNRTGWMDGYYSVPAGSIDGGEELIKAAIRETKEEVNVEVHEKDLALVHTIHCLTHGEEWLGVFFTASSWIGHPKVNEPDKHSEVRWVSANSLPDNMIPYVKQAYNLSAKKVIYSEYQI